MIQENPYWSIERRMKISVSNGGSLAFRVGDVAEPLEKWAREFMKNNVDLEMKPDSAFITYKPQQQGEPFGEIRIRFLVRLKVMI